MILFGVMAALYLFGAGVTYEAMEGPMAQDDIRRAAAALWPAYLAGVIMAKVVTAPVNAGRRVMRAAAARTTRQLPQARARTRAVSGEIEAPETLDSDDDWSAGWDEAGLQ